MQKINELLKMIEAQEKAGGESCTPGTELELGENIVDSYGKVSFIHKVLEMIQNHPSFILQIILIVIAKLKLVDIKLTNQHFVH